MIFFLTNNIIRQKDLKLWAGVNDFGKLWTQISSKCFNNTRSPRFLRARWDSSSFKQFISGQFSPDAYSHVNDNVTAVREKQDKREEQIPYISYALANVLFDTSSVSAELHATVMKDMTRASAFHDIDENVLGQLFEREIRRLTSGKDELSGDINENGWRIGLVTTPSTDNQNDQFANNHSLENALCSDDDDQGEPWNNRQIIDENSCEYNEDEHEEIQLSDEILMIRERIWTVFACIGMGIVTDQEVIVRSYVQPQRNGPDASDICRNFLYDNQSRSFTSIVRLMEIVYHLLASNRCTTLRSLYYTLQSYFRNQEDCN
jgi:hypothetical protein